MEGEITSPRKETAHAAAARFATISIRRRKKCHRNVFLASKLIIWNENLAIQISNFTRQIAQHYDDSLEDKTTQWHQM
jgi:hypothetical protein